jgi:hypothetical protein
MNKGKKKIQYPAATFHYMSSRLLASDVTELPMTEAF